MNEDTEKLSQAVQELGRQYGLTKVRIETPTARFLFEMSDNLTHLTLVKTQSVIRVMGRQSIVSIGDSPTDDYSTLEDAEAGVREYWSNHLKEKRKHLTPEQKRKRAQLQKNYRERKKAKAVEISRRQ